MEENRLLGSGIRYLEIDGSGLRLGEREIREEVERRTVRASMFVALGKDVKANESVLMWSLRNSGGMKIYILHVHPTIPMLDSSIISPDLQIIDVDQQIKREERHKILDKYIEICNQAGVRAEKVYEEMDSIGDGIVQLISKHKIKFLVMGAAADECYSRRMEIKSKKAIYVHREAPSFCHIWFTCKGNLIHTRAGKLGCASMEIGSPQFQPSTSTEAAQDSNLPSVSEERREQTNVLNLVRAQTGYSNVLWGSQSASPYFSTGSSDNIPRLEANENEGQLVPMFEMKNEDYHHSSAVTCDTMQEGSMNDGYLEKYVVEILAISERSNKKAHEETVKRMRAEKQVFDLIRRAKTYETLCAEEVRCRKEIEEALQRERKEAEKMKQQLDKVLEDFTMVQVQKLSLEYQIQDSNKEVDELEQKLGSSVELLKTYKEQRDEWEIERDNALEIAVEMGNKQAESSSSPSIFLSQFSYWEIALATSDFCQSFKIGEGDYGIIYRGELRHTQVAIKIRHPDSLLEPLEFEQEVNILSKLRHPNIVNLIGASPEARALIYEYLPNGSLEDRLNCKNNTPPLPWKTRISIATELCSALIFLHSSWPEGFIVKPSNVLLDANFVCKLSSFEICHQLHRDGFPDNPTGTLDYIAPLAMSELTSKSNAYSFGIILLRLLTGRSAFDIVEEVQCALDEESLQDLLDSTAGDWPFVQAKQLAHLALRCSDDDPDNRPDLAFEVWRVLEPMRVSCGGVLSHQNGSEDCLEIPSYFTCPIIQEIMQDPVVAADGFTYESEALQGWFESGHNTSPMTNLELPHCNLLPNHSLRSAIQEWQQKREG